MGLLAEIDSLGEIEPMAMDVKNTPEAYSPSYQESVSGYGK